MDHTTNSGNLHLLPEDRYEALLAAEGALTVAQTARATAEAERAHYEALWEQGCAERDALQAHLEEGMRMMTALQAERDQAAPVRAALERWYLSTGNAEDSQHLMQVYAAWRYGHLREG